MKKALCILLILFLAVSMLPTAAASEPIELYDLYALYDELFIRCLDGETEMTINVLPECRKGISSDELWDGLWTVFFEAFDNRYKVTYSELSNGTMRVYVTNAHLRDGIRMYYASIGSGSVTLSSDEKKALNIVQSAVKDMLHKYEYGSIPLETAIYDYICDHLEFNWNGDDPRYYSSAYGILHGQGCCQVYADLFYLMTSMAGFYPQYICGKANNGSHLWNTIGIGDENMMVDVTYGDMGNNYPPYHYYMNFGLDRRGDRTWSKYVFPYPFAQKTKDDHTFYSNQSSNTGYVAKDLKDAAEYIVWKAQRNEKTVEVLIKGKKFSDDSIHNAIWQALKARRISLKNKDWLLWNKQINGDSVLVLRWTKF